MTHASSQPPPYLRIAADGIVLEVYVAPRAKLSKVVGLHGGYPKIALAAPPIDGRANEELVTFLRGLFGIPRAHIELLRGDTSKKKTVLLRSVTLEQVRAELEKTLKSD